jgi:large subunit ribosomal protein L17
MRHRLKGRKLGRTTAHRQAMERNIVTSLFVNGRVVTTVTRAKEFRGTAERMITIAKRVNDPKEADSKITNFRRILAVVQDRRVARKIVDDVAKRFEQRPGGYTRVIKLGGCRWDGDGRGWFAWNRLGDNGPRAIWELVERKSPEEEQRAAGRGKAAVEGEARARAERKTGKKKGEAAAAPSK